MNNDETRLINPESINNETPVKSDSEKKLSKGKVVTAAAGIVAGAGIGTAAGIMASNDDVKANPVEKVNTTSEAPEADDVILANNEGIRFAHVQADNFQDAFAQARAQVGPGGAFEYNGKIYGTYYANEWNQMSSQERADFQSRVSDVAPSHHSATAHHSTTTHHVAQAQEKPAVAQTEATEHHEPTEENPGSQAQTVVHNTETTIDDTPSSGVRVLGVETVQQDGTDITFAYLEHEGEHAVMADVDDDGIMDYFIYDENGNGIIEPNEIHDMSAAGVHIHDLLALQQTQQGNLIAACDDNLPDYINDADTVMEA